MSGLYSPSVWSLQHQNTPLIVAASSGKPEGVRFLLSIPQVKMAINGKRVDGNTALHRAAEAGSLPVVQLLVNNQANFAAQNNKAQTPLERAKKKNKRDVVKYLTAIMNGTTPTASIAASTSALSPGSHLAPSLPSTSDAASLFSYERRLSGESILSDMSMLSLSQPNSRSNTNEAPKPSRSNDASPMRTSRTNTVASNGSITSMHNDKQLKSLQTENKLLQARMHQLQEDFDVTHEALNDTSAALHRVQLESDAAVAAGNDPSDLTKFELGMGQLGKLTKMAGSKSNSKTNVVASKYRGSSVALVNAHVSRQQLESVIKGGQFSELLDDLHAVLELKHPHLATCFGYTYFGDSAATATMCLLFARTLTLPLYEVLHEQGATDQLLVDWSCFRVQIHALMDVAAALTYMHHSGLVHGQVSSHSVLIDASGRGCLSDAGLPVCRLLASKGLKTSIWSSPELALDPKDMRIWQKLEAATDVYSLGVVVVETLAQWDAEGSVALEEAVTTMPEPCWQLLARAMTAKEVTGRPSLLAVSQVLSILRSRKGEELELSKCKAMLTGPVTAPWKPPAELQPVTKDASFATQIKCLPTEAGEVRVY
jgi:hypothetical protein